jgi:hypothetical protein
MPPSRRRHSSAGMRASFRRVRACYAQCDWQTLIYGRWVLDDRIPSAIKRRIPVRAHHRILDDWRANVPTTHSGLVQRSPHRRLGSVGEFGQLAQGQPITVASRHELNESSRCATVGRDLAVPTNCGSGSFVGRDGYGTPCTYPRSRRPTRRTVRGRGCRWHALAPRASKLTVTDAAPEGREQRQSGAVRVREFPCPFPLR